MGLHGVIAGGVAQCIEEPLGVLPTLLNGEVLQCKELLSIDLLILPSCPKAVLPIEEDVGHEDMNGVGPISDWNVKIRYFPFVFFEVIWYF